MAQERRAPVNKWVVAVAVAVTLVFLYVVRLAVLPFLIAAAIAYVTAPAIVWAQRRVALSRRLAAVIAFVVIMALFAGIGYWLVASLATDLASTLRDLPELLHKFFAELLGGEERAMFGRTLNASTLSHQIVDALFGAFGTPQDMLVAALVAFGGLTGAVLVIVLIFYFLDAGPRLARGVLWLVPPEYRDEVAEVAEKIGPMLRRYLLGLVVIVAFATAASWLAIRFALGLPFAFLLALMTGLFELIPVVGPMASAVLVGLLALEQHGLWAVIAFAVYVTLFRLAIDRLIGPLVLGHAVDLHPVVVMFAFLAGGLFLGIAGVILAVPVAASAKIVLEHYYSQPTRRAGQS